MDLDQIAELIDEEEKPVPIKSQTSKKSAKIKNKIAGPSDVKSDTLKNLDFVVTG